MKSGIELGSNTTLRTRYHDLEKLEEVIRISLTKFLCGPFLQQSRIEKKKLPDSCQDYDDATVSIEPHPILTPKADKEDLPNIADFVIAQRQDAFYNQMKQLVETSYCLFTFDHSTNQLTPNHTILGAAFYFSGSPLRASKVRLTSSRVLLI